MCLAEALLRVPDRATADRLIRDKLVHGDWRSHLGNSPSLFVNAATWGLLVTGRLVSTRSGEGLFSALTKLLRRGRGRSSRVVAGCARGHRTRSGSGRLAGAGGFVVQAYQKRAPLVLDWTMTGVSAWPSVMARFCPCCGQRPNTTCAVWCMSARSASIRPRSAATPV